VRGYVLTERGKLLVAMLIVLLIVLPTIIITVWAVSREMPPSEPTTGSDETVQNDSSLASPEPVGDPTSDAPSTSQEAPDNDTVAFDYSAGTMTFQFAPDSQTELNDSTVAKINELLTSPKNTNDAQIAVEIPQLPDEETAALTNAIITAFADLEVSLSKVVFFVYTPDSGISTFDVNISFR